MLVTAGRFWNGKGSDASAILEWAEHNVSLSDQVLVAVNPADKSDAVNKLNQMDRVEAFIVSPWGKWTPALNALLYRAGQLKADQILYQSTEIRLPAQGLAKMQSLLGPDVLNVGSRLEGHDWRPGTNPINGVTTPWNTNCLWSVPWLSLVGFLEGTNGYFSYNGIREDGVEEPDTEGILQMLHGLKVILTQVEGSFWGTDHEDPDRAAAHAEKMALKHSRPARRIQRLNIPSGIVHHIP